MNTTAPFSCRSRDWSRGFLVTAAVMVAFGLATATPARAEDSKPAAKFVPKIQPSVYSPKVERDPFVSSAQRQSGKIVTSVSPDQFKLQGILFHPTRPSAMVNNELVTLNKPVTITTSVGKIQVVAIAVTRDIVKLRVGEETVELRMELPKPVAAKAGARTPAGPAATVATGDSQN